MKIEERVEELELKIIEQEHRIIPAIVNYWKARKELNHNDPKRLAAFKALIWQIFFSPTTVVVTGGIIGLATLIAFIWQNNLISEQNSFLRQQLEAQQQQIITQQKVNNQNLKNQSIVQIYGSDYTNNPRVKAEALKTLVQVERATMSYERNSLSTDYINLHEANLNGAWLENSELVKVSFRKAKLNRANLSAAILDTCSFRYAMMNEAVLLNATINNSQIAFTELDSAVFNSSTFNDVFFGTCSMNGSTFGGVEFVGASFYKCDLRNADFGEIENWESLSIEKCNIHGLTAPQEFIEWLRKEEFGNFFEANSDGGFFENRDKQLRLEEGI